MVNIYSVIVYTSGLFGLLFQVLGIGTRGWLLIHSSTKTITPIGNTSVDVTMNSGLVDIDMCVTYFVNNVKNRTCQIAPLRTLTERLSQMEDGASANGIQSSPEEKQAAVGVLFGDFDVLPYLTVFALISSILALVVFTFQHNSCCAKFKSRVEIVSLLLWLVAVVLLAAAVGIAGHLNSFLSSMYAMVSNMKLQTQPGYGISLDISVGFPWSILLSGGGMGFSFINVVAIVIDICVTKFKRSTDYWKYGRVHLDESHQKVELLEDTE